MRRAAAGRRFVTCAGNEVKTQRTARRRLRASRGGGRRAAASRPRRAPLNEFLAPLVSQRGRPSRAEKRRGGGRCVYLLRALRALMCSGLFMWSTRRETGGTPNASRPGLDEPPWIKTSQHRRHTSQGRTKGPRDPSRPKSRLVDRDARSTTKGRARLTTIRLLPATTPDPCVNEQLSARIEGEEIGQDRLLDKLLEVHHAWARVASFRSGPCCRECSSHARARFSTSRSA